MAASSSDGAVWRWMGGLLLLAPLVLILVPVFAGSDNVHPGLDSTAFDRLGLALRTFWPDGVGVAGPNPRAVDPNFPLGTAVVYAVPHLLHADPVLLGRLISLGAGLTAMVTLGILVGLAAGRELALPAAASVWALPAFVRGAVVSGEESLYTAALLLGLLGLIGAHSARGRGDRRATVLLAAGSCLAVNAMVAFRIDAALAIPGFALLGLSLGARVGIPYALGCALSSFVHFFVAWSVQDAPLVFLHTSAGVTAATAPPGSSRGMVDFCLMLRGQSGGTVVLLAGLVGAVALLRRGGPAGRLFVGLFAWLHLAYGGAVLLSIPNPGIPRYFVPLLVAWIPLALVGCREVLGRLHDGLWRVAVLGLLAFVLVTGGRAAHAEAEAARLPDGIEDAAEWLSQHAADRPILVTQQGPELIVLAGLAPSRTRALQTIGNGFPDAAPFTEQLRMVRAEFIVLVGYDVGVRGFRAARLPDWDFAWQGGEVVIYERTGASAD